MIAAAIEPVLRFIFASEPVLLAQQVLPEAGAAVKSARTILAVCGKTKRE